MGNTFTLVVQLKDLTNTGSVHHDVLVHETEGDADDAIHEVKQQDDAVALVIAVFPGALTEANYTSP